MSKDRLYDSNDSRDIEKGSFSVRMERWLEEVVDLPAGNLCQKDFFSGGEGCEFVSRGLRLESDTHTGRYTPESFTAKEVRQPSSLMYIAIVACSPLNLNSFGSSRLPLIPSANDGRSL